MLGNEFRSLLFLLCFVCCYFIYLWEKFSFFLLVHSFYSCLRRETLLWPKAAMLCCLLAESHLHDTWGLYEIRSRALPPPQGFLHNLKASFSYLSCCLVTFSHNLKNLRQVIQIRILAGPVQQIPVWFSLAMKQIPLSSLFEEQICSLPLS